MTSFPTLHTNRLLLRQFTETDIENVYKGLSHPEVIKYYGVSYSSLEATKTQMQFFADLEKNETGCWWAICNTENNVFYGACGVNNMNKEHKKAEMGFWLLPEFWGQGIIIEAAAAICEYAFTNLQLHRIEAMVETENMNSKKVLEKLQFIYEGTMKECEYKNGKYISLDIYALLNKSSI